MKRQPYMEKRRGIKAIPHGMVQQTVTVDACGHIIIPASMREALRIKPEDELIAIVNSKSKIIWFMPAVDFNRRLGRTAERISRRQEKISP